MTARFYFASDLKTGEFNLSDEIVRHLNVLRYCNNQAIILFNGDGNDYLAIIKELEKRHAIVVIEKIEQNKVESNLKLHLAACLIANDKFEFILQKATELGISEITPIISQNVQRIPTDKLLKKFVRWQGIIIAACEQSGRSIIPKLNTPLKFDNYVKVCNTVVKLVMSPHHLSQSNTKGLVDSCSLLIGPEGGFTPEEVKLAIKHSFSSLSLGNRIMRAETAALAGISLIQAKFGDFNYNF